MSIAENLDSKHLAQGDVLPSPTKDKLRIYNMRFCPYAQRTLLALQAKQIPHEVVNISLANKPDWYLERNPLGKVPSLELNGKITYESLVCNEWLDEAFPNSRQLLPKDPLARAHQKMQVERMSTLASAFYGMLRDDSPEKIQAVNNALKQFESELQANYYCGSEPGWVDYAIWPHLERVRAFAKVGDGKIKLSDCPKLEAYCNRMLDRPEVKTIARSPELHLAFLNSYKAGHPEYDLKEKQSV